MLEAPADDWYKKQPNITLFHIDLEMKEKKTNALDNTKSL
jgi:hypothetical protein